MPHYSKIIAMFAVLIIHIPQNAGSKLAFSVQAFFMPGHIVYHIWYRVPPCGALMRPQHFVDVISSGKGTDTFILKTYCYA